MSLEEKKRKRYKVLRWIYETADGREIIGVDLRKLLEPNLDGHERRQEEDRLSDISDYLIGEYLIKQLDDSGLYVALTHIGIVEIERSIEEPNRPTEHFPPVQVIQNFNAPVGAVQTGNQNTANVTQNIGAEVTDITALLRELRQHIVDDTPERQQEGLELLEGLEAEARSPNQSKSRVKLYLKEVGTFVKDTGKDLLVSIGTELLKDQVGLK